jgi:hypothetical protein
LVYNLVRQVMLEAASRQNVDLNRISFMPPHQYLWVKSGSGRRPRL